MQSKSEMREYIEWHNSFKSLTPLSPKEQEALMLTVEPELSEEQQEMLANHESAYVVRQLARRQDLTERVQHQIAIDDRFTVVYYLAKYTTNASIQEKLSAHSDEQVRAALCENKNVASPSVRDIARKAEHHLAAIVLSKHEAIDNAFRQQLGLK